jgi:hypothetical protein
MVVWRRWKANRDKSDGLAVADDLFCSYSWKEERKVERKAATQRRLWLSDSES